MLEDFSGKFGKLKMPEGSLVRKLERIKKSSQTVYGRGDSAVLFPEMIEQLRRVPEEISRKIEDVVNTKTEMIRATLEAVKNLEIHVSKVDQAVILTGKGTDEFKQRLDKIDKTVLELLSLYEVVSTTVNLFVVDKNNPANQKMSEIEKKIEYISNKPPEAPPAMVMEFETKFKDFEKNIEELKKMVESKAIDENALVEKIATVVMERMRPQHKRKPIYTGIQFSPQMPPATAAVPARQPEPQYKPDTQYRPEPQYIDEDGEVRLEYLNNRPETSIILLNWIEFLMEKVGRNNLFDVLEYYMEIGWINEEVSSKMMAYASGIDYFVERPSWKLLPEDHTKSLLFIEQLRGNKVDKMLFSRLERDVEKIIRKNSEVSVH